MSIFCLLGERKLRIKLKKNNHVCQTTNSVKRCYKGKTMQYIIEWKKINQQYI